jgi:hypothetical protein
MDVCLVPSSVDSPPMSHHEIVRGWTPHGDDPEGGVGWPRISVIVGSSTLMVCNSHHIVFSILVMAIPKLTDNHEHRTLPRKFHSR